MRTVKLGSLGLRFRCRGSGAWACPGLYGARFQGRNFARARDLLDTRALTKEKGLTSAQPVLAQDEDIVLIPRTTRRNDLEGNAAAIEVELRAGDLGRIDAVFPKVAATGERYLDMVSVNRRK